MKTIFAAKLIGTVQHKGAIFKMTFRDKYKIEKEHTDYCLHFPYNCNNV